jgi:site-specific recombinase XerC
LGLAADVVKRIYLIGVGSVAPSVVRDAAMVVFAYIFSGLRDSSVVSLDTSDVELTDYSIRARLSYEKGRPASQGLPVDYTGGADIPLALIHRWADVRG